MNRMNMYNQMYAAGDEVSSGRRPNTTGPNVQRDMPSRVTGGRNKVLTGSGRPPVGTMAKAVPFKLPLSKMGTLSRGGIGGLIAAGGLGLFEIGRQTGFDPEKLGQAAAQVQKSLEEVANEAVEVAKELGQPIKEFVDRVVQGYQSQMGGGRMMSDMNIQERNEMQQQQLGFDQSSNSIDDIEPINETTPYRMEMASLRIQLENLQKQLRNDGSNGDLQAIVNTTAQMDSIRKRMADIQMEMARQKMISENPYNLPFDPDAKAARKKLEEERRPALEEEYRSNPYNYPFNKISREERERLKKQNFAKGGEAFPDLTGDGQVTQADILRGRGVFAEGDEVSRETIEMEAQKAGIPLNEVDQALSQIEAVEPEMEKLNEMVAMVMQMIQSGASEEEIIMALQQMGLDQEDIQAVFEAVMEAMEVEQAAQSDPIQSELSQMA